MPKQGLGIDVLTAARERLAYVFDHFDRVYVSFSGGKDSTVLLHLAAEEAVKRERKIGVLFVDLEAQYKLTIEHLEEMFDHYAHCIEPYWIALPLSLRNAVSVFEPQWMCWDPNRRDDWVRTPPEWAITDEDYFRFFRRGMEFEEFVPAFGRWYATHNWSGGGIGALTACLVGIRSDESLNRFRALVADKSTFEDPRTCRKMMWTTWKGGAAYNAYPIYDWRTEDIWTYCGRFQKPYNRLYDRMHQAGLSIHQQRICQPYGDDQRKGLWLYQIIEPETWGRVVARVNGANSGALYSRESGNINGTIRVKRPPHLTWQEFAEYLLESMPKKTAEHYRNKIAVFLNWWHQRGYQNGIPDEAPPKEENAREKPSWRRICKTLLRNDYWCKGLSFTQTSSEAYEKYKALMKRRRKQWDLPDSISINGSS